MRLIVSIDTEEDNWIPARSGITTRNIQALPALERRFERMGVRSTYFTTYQVALDPSSAGVMREIANSGRAEIGGHLHPWNTPPLLPRMETMLLNIEPELQVKKIELLTRQLEESVGVSPRSFRAGRFGFGASTARALIETGFKIDSSVTPFMSWVDYDRGPSHVGAPLDIYRISGRQDVRIPDDGPLVEVPLSSGYNGWHPRIWPLIHRGLNHPVSRFLHLGGIAARTQIARLVILSPEIHDHRDLVGLARALVRGGLPFLHVFWHSPSMTPGLSPFCATPQHVDRLFARFDRFIDTMSRDVTLQPVTISEMLSEPVPVEEEARPQVLATLSRESLQPVTVAAADVDAAFKSPDPLAPNDLGGAAPEPAPVARMGRHTAVYLAGILIGRAVSFVMLPFYTRFLTTADYGVMQLVEMTLDVIAIIAGARIASGIHRYYFKAETEEQRNAVLATSAVLIGVSFVAFGLWTGFLAEPLTVLVLGSAKYTKLLQIAAVTFALQALILVPMAILQLEKRSVLLTGITTLKLCVQLTLNIVLLAGMRLGVEAVFISTLVANLVIGVVLAWIVYRRMKFTFSPTAAHSLLAYGLPLVGTQFASFFVTFGDRYFLRVHADVSSVGLYSLAYQFGFLVGAIGYAPFAMVWEPTRFQIATRPDRDALYSRAFQFMNLILLPASVATALYVRDFINVMSAPEYHSAYQIVPLILIAYMLQSWGYFQEVGILIRERTGFVTLANWLAAFVAFVAYETLIPRWFGWGAAIATVLSFLVRWIVTYMMSQRLLPVRYDWKPIWRMLAVSTAVVAVGILLPYPGIVASVIIRTALFIAYLWLIWHLGFIPAEEKSKIRRLMRSPRTEIASLLA
ncbi:MAG TPA: oligosaccharide flippase family protein [Gemmatimonadaceae bacterium]|nr:oligosaccharide flippase family protein [Gemmatimonadaceae bacterium]